MIPSRFSVCFAVCCLIAQARCQKGFQKAHDLFSTYWVETLHTKKSDPAGLQHLRRRAIELPNDMDKLLTQAILDYLNNEPKPSAMTLKRNLSKALTGPVGDQDAEDVADVVTAHRGKTFFVTFGVGTCASCSSTWFGEFILKGNKYVLQASTNSFARDQTIHLTSMESGNSFAIVLYGTQLGDPHNGLNLSVFSPDAEASVFKPIWSLVDQPEGEVSFAGTTFTVNSDTTPTRGPSTRRQKRTFEFKDERVELVRTEISSIPVAAF